MPNDLFQLVGTCLDDKFRVEKFVAEGGFAVVYSGQHLSLDRAIAIKVLKTPAELNERARDDFIAKFRLEAQTIARLSHANIVQVIDFGVSSMPSGERAPWMVLEWLTGRSLEKELAGRRGAGGRAPQQVLELLEPIFDALAYAHEEGIAHRDVKPANIMIVPTKRGEILKLLDFGIVKIMDKGETAETNLAPTRGTLSAHSPAYAAPEQITGLRTGPWTDVHALGLLVTEVMTDLSPYEGKNITTLLREILSPQRPTPARHRIDAGPWEAVLGKALALEPAERFKDAGEFRVALRSAIPATVKLVASADPFADTLEEELDEGYARTEIFRPAKPTGVTDPTPDAEPAPANVAPILAAAPSPPGETSAAAVAAKLQPLPPPAPRVEVTAASAAPRLEALPSSTQEKATSAALAAKLEPIESPPEVDLAPARPVPRLELVSALPEVEHSAQPPPPEPAPLSAAATEEVAVTASSAPKLELVAPSAPRLELPPAPGSFAKVDDSTRTDSRSKLAEMPRRWRGAASAAVASISRELRATAGALLGKISSERRTAARHLESMSRFRWPMAAGLVTLLVAIGYLALRRSGGDLPVKPEVRTPQATPRATLNPAETPRPNTASNATPSPTPSPGDAPPKPTRAEPPDSRDSAADSKPAPPPEIRAPASEGPAAAPPSLGTQGPKAASSGQPAAIKNTRGVGKRLQLTDISLELLASFGTGPPSSDDTKRKQLLKDALVARKSGEPDKAIKLAAGANRIRSNAPTLLLLAEEQTGVRQYANAWVNADRCASESKNDTALKRIFDACNSLKSTLKQKVGRVIVSLANPPPSGVQVRVAGHNFPEPLYGQPYFIEPGKIHVEASAPGFADFYKDLLIKAGEEQTVTIALSRLSQP